MPIAAPLIIGAASVGSSLIGANAAHDVHPTNGTTATCGE